MSDDEYSLFVQAFITSIESSCTGDIYCKVASEYMDVIGGIFRSKKFHWSATIIWVKDIFVLGRSKYHRRYEPLWHGWHSKSKSSFCDARDLDDVWEINRPRVSDEHPTMMPVELPERAIKNSSETGDVVYEPFSGSGTTLVACENLRRRCRAIEISPSYVSVALERMSQAFPELEIKLLERV
jgi:DNA modification methylase